MSRRAVPMAVPRYLGVYLSMVGCVGTRHVLDLRRHFFLLKLKSCGAHAPQAGGKYLEYDL